MRKEMRGSTGFPTVIDYANESDLLQIFPEGSHLYSDRWVKEDWQFGDYYEPPFAIPETCSKQHLVIIYTEVPEGTQLEEITEGHRSNSQPSPGDISLVPAMVRQSAYWNQSHRYIALSLDPDAFARRLPELTEFKRVELLPHSVKPDPLIHSIGLALRNEFESEQLGTHVYVDSLITTLFTHLCRHYSDQARQSFWEVAENHYSQGLSARNLKQVVDYVHQHLEQNLSLVELAAVVNLSPSYFANQFKQATGLTPHQYLIQVRLTRAKQLLLTGELTIAEIAHSLGFAHQSHFTFHFKRAFGGTPKQFLQEQ
jgi:AraC family transcriptional regulator